MGPRCCREEEHGWTQSHQASIPTPSWPSGSSYPWCALDPAGGAGDDSPLGAVTAQPLLAGVALLQGTTKEEAQGHSL